MGKQSWFFSFLLLLNSPHSYAFSPISCKDVLRTLGGASVEIEMDTNAAIIQLLTTKTGTVGGLMKFWDLPVSYYRWAFKTFPKKDPRKIPWASLPIEMKQTLLEHISNKKKPSSFFRDRTVPNTKVQETIELIFKKPTVFLGREYQAGSLTSLVGLKRNLVIL